MGRINNNSSIPMYKQISKLLIDELKKSENSKNSHMLDSNDKLPTERFLSDTFNVSRVTIRQAMNLLEKENYIVRKQGKGTYFNREKIKKPIKESKSFSKTVLDSGRTPGAKLISASIELSDVTDRRTFNIGENDYVLIMKRLRFVDDIPYAYEVSHFDRNFFDLKDIDFNNRSFYQYMEEEKGIIFHTVEKTIEIQYSDKEVSSVLGIDRNTPVILMKSTVANQENDIIHVVYEYLLSDKFIFQL